MKQLIKAILAKLGLFPTIAKEYMMVERSKLVSDSLQLSKTMKVALVGFGRQGNTIAHAIKQTNKLEVVDVLDLRADMGQKIAAFPNATFFNNLDEFWAKASSWDAIVIATTAKSHYDIAKKALEAGVKAVMIEKPVTTSIQDAMDLIELAKEKKANVAVNHTRRHLSSYHGLRKLIESGIIGKPKAINFMIGRSGMAMIGSHLFDTSFFLFRTGLAKIRAEFDEELDPTFRGNEFVDPCGRCSGVFENGIRFTMDLSADIPTRQLFFVIMGENGRIEVDEKHGVLRILSQSGKIFESEFLFSGALGIANGKGIVELVKGKKPTCDLTDGMKALEAVIACHISNAAKSSIDLPLEDKVVKNRFDFA